MHYGVPIMMTLVLAMLYTPSSFGDTSHEYITSWGYLGSSGEARFSGPNGIATDYLGNVYVADTGNAKIQKYNNAGGFILEWNDNGGIVLVSPVGVAIVDDRVYVLDKSLESVIVYDFDGNYISSWGSHGSESGQFQLPFSIGAGIDVVYVVDTGNSRVQVFTLDGEYIKTIGNDNDTGTKLRIPVGIAVASDSTLFISDSGNNNIYHYSSDGVLLSVIDGQVGGVPLRARGLAIDADDKLYVADSRNERVLRLEPDGQTLSVWGNYGTGIYQFVFPTDLAIDLYGQIFVADTGAHSIKKYSTPLTLEGDARSDARDAAKALFESSVGDNRGDTAPAASADPAEPNIPADLTTPTEPVTDPEPQGLVAPTDPRPTVTAVPGDLTKPTIHAPHDITVEAVGTLTIIDIGTATASDESGIRSIETNAPDSFSLGTSTVIWTAIDGANNLAIDTQLVTVVDTIPPTIEAPDDITVESVSPDRNYVDIRVPVATDIVGVLDVTSDAPEYFGIGRTLVTWTAHDIVGNTASVVQQVTVTDTTTPDIMAPPDVVLEAASLDENDVFLGDARVVDNGEIISVTNDAPQTFALGKTTVTWSAADSHGNVGHDTQLVTLTDTTPPDIPTLDDIVIEATSTSQNTVELENPTADDIQTLKYQNDAPSTYSIGDTIVTWIITDASGLSTQSLQTVSVVDTTPPTITPPSTIVSEATSPVQNTVNLGEISISDVSDIASISNDAPDTYLLGYTTVTWSVTDIYDNTAIETQIVQIVDTTPPSIFAPDDITAEYVGQDGNVVELGSAVTADLVGVAELTHNGPDKFGPGTHPVAWRATDHSGNESVAIQTVFILDTLKPVITVPDNIDVEATDPDGTWVDIGRPVVADESDNVRIDHNAPPLFELGQTIVTWSAIDSSENVAIGTQIITVHDTILPEITAPDDVVLEAASPSENIVDIGMATASDSVSDVTISNDGPSTYSVGTTTVTWSAVDSSGNTASQTQTVTLIDTLSPVITAPADVTVEATSADGTIVDIGTATADDEIGIETITSDSPELFLLGETLVTWTVTDEAGNTASATQLVTLVDTTPPQIVAPQGLTVEATSELETVVDIGTPVSSDEIEVESVTNNAPQVFSLGETIVLWTATDVSGNERTVEQIVNIVDTTPPTITLPPRVEVEATSHDTTIADIGSASADDAVGIASITSNAPEFYELGSTFVVWTATDTSDNIASNAQQVVVIDTTPPELVIPDDIVIEATSTQTSIDIGEPRASDIASANITITNDAPETFEIGLTTITWTATDDVGNFVSLTQSIDVVDTTSPSLSIPDDLTLEADSADGAIAIIGRAIVEDVNDIATITNDEPEIFPIGITTVTWVVTDVSGNESTSAQLVTVVDTLPPRIVASADITMEAVSRDGTPVTLGEPYTKDIVGVTSIKNDAPDLFDVGSTLVTWTATDDAQNIGVAFQTVTIVDTTAPVIAPASDLIINATSPLTPVIIEVPISTDIIDDAPIISSDAPESFPLGATLVMWNSTDSKGNTSTMIQSVTVLACGNDHTQYNPISGTSLDDTLDGTDRADLIFALGGDDVVNAGDGDDCVFGSSGDDVLLGGNGNDSLNGGSGNDVVRGQDGDDSLNGYTGDDIIDGGSGNDMCESTARSDNDSVLNCEL